MDAMDTDAHQDPTPPTSEPYCWEEISRRIQESYYHDCEGILERRYRTHFPSICQLLLKGWCDCFELDHGRCRNDTELHYLKKDIAYILGFEPVSESTADDVMGLNEKQLDVIEKIFNNIICVHRDTYECEDDIVVSITLFLIEIDSGLKKKRVECPPRILISPVFQVINPQNGKGGESDQVIDSDGRVYKSWLLFLNENLLQSGKCCYPENGRYILDDEGALNLHYGETAACSWKKKALRVADAGVGVGGIVLEVGGIVSAAVSAPAVIAPLCVGGSLAVGSYVFIRSLVSQADRGIHKQSVGLRDRDSFRNWVSIVGSTFGFAAFGATKYVSYLASKGIELSRKCELVANGMRYSSMTVNGVGIVESVHSTFVNRNDVTFKDFAMLTAQILFFTRSVFSSQNVQEIYEAQQDQIIQEHKSQLRSNRHKKVFEGVKRETMKGETSKIAGKAKVIRSINHVSDADKFYASVIKLRKGGIKTKFDDTEASTIKVDNETFSMSVVRKLDYGVVSSVLSAPTFKGLCMLSKNRISCKAIIDKIADVLQYLYNCLQIPNTKLTDIKTVIAHLRDICSQIPLSEEVFEAINIAIDLKCCKSFKEGVQIAHRIFSLIYKLYDGKLSNILRSTEEETVNNNDGGSSDNVTEACVKDLREACRLPVLLDALQEGLVGAEELYHLPSHLPSVLTLEEYFTLEDYLSIGQNALGISNVSANITHNQSCTNVYFEGYGVVFVTVKPCERIIGVRKVTPNDTEIYYFDKCPYS